MVDYLQICVSSDIDVRYLEKVILEAKRELQNLETRRIMKLTFSNPKLVNMNGFLQRKEVVYGYRSVLKEKSRGPGLLNKH